jgi:uncharacterized lipoprotein YddW (UPF0748 family)
MFRRIVVACAVVALLGTGVGAAEKPPALMREFRGVWVATVSNIDWPSRPGLPVKDQKAELLAILDKAKELRLNAVIFQVRPMADALYESKLEPWSGFLTGQTGRAPDPAWDPLAFAVAEAHARGLELHAWFNPYRARHPSARGPLPADHIVKRRPDLAKSYGTHHWMNPTHPDVQAHSLAVILDVVKRYDVDGIHIDDYFYPYKEKDAPGKIIPFPDEDTWAEYQKGGGKLTREDWRRDSVNHFIERMYKDVKAAKPWVKVGISPFGIWRPGHPTGIAGLDQYGELYADARLWLNRGWVDYFSPQLYWPIAQERQSFPKLLAWWADENVKRRHLWPGQYTNRVTGTAKGWPAKEITEQIAIVRKQKGTTGEIHFSMKALMRDPGGVASALKKVYEEPALVPESPWLAVGPGPARPNVVRARVDGADVYRVRTEEGVRFVVLRTEAGGNWTTTVRGVESGGVTTIPAGIGRVVFCTVDRTGRESEGVEGPR